MLKPVAKVTGMRSSGFGTMSRHTRSALARVVGGHSVARELYELGACCETHWPHNWLVIPIFPRDIRANLSRLREPCRLGWMTKISSLVSHLDSLA